MSSKASVDRTSEVSNASLLMIGVTTAIEIADAAITTPAKINGFFELLEGFDFGCSGFATDC